MKSKILALKRRTKILYSNKIILLQRFFQSNHNKALVAKYRRIDYVSVMVSRLDQVMSRTRLFSFKYKKSDKNKLFLGRHRIPASVATRALRWKCKGISIFDRILNSLIFDDNSSKFELFFARIMDQVIEKLNELLDEPFHAVRNPTFVSRAIPFLTGTPDFVIFNRSRRPVCVIEVKEIHTHKEFKKHVFISENGFYQISENSEYFRQLRIYLEVFGVASGFLIIKFCMTKYVFKVLRQKFTIEEIQKLENFYINFFLPFSLLNRYPKKSDQGLTFFSGHELSTVLKHYQNHKIKQIVENSFRSSQGPNSPVEFEEFGKKYPTKILHVSPAFDRTPYR